MYQGPESEPEASEQRSRVPSERFGRFGRRRATSAFLRLFLVETSDLARPCRHFFNFTSRLQQASENRDIEKE